MSPRLRPDIATTDTEHGTVLLDERSGRYFQLNLTGARVLRALLDGQSADRIADGLASDHHLDPRRAQHTSSYRVLVSVPPLSASKRSA